ncbi:MAG: hypothetical protein M1823_005042 [Watsoniomyces obsoletus]|nr:MAG: hypothetical protein M1823_005042 [Watsoniomyces obsoletus]
MASANNNPISDTEGTGSPPLPTSRLDSIATTACSETFTDVISYDHTRCESWNNSIISSILQRIVEEVPRTYKFAVTSTIIQHVEPEHGKSSSAGVGINTTNTTEQSTTSGQDPNTLTANNTDSKRVQARRGIHSATAGYWNAEKDGIWNFKYDASDKGIEVIVCVVWISLS